MSNKDICKAVTVLVLLAIVTCCIPAVSASSWQKIWGPTSTVVVGVDRTAPKPWSAQAYATENTTGDIYQLNDNGTGTKVGGPGKMFVTAGWAGTLYGLSPDGSGVYRDEGTPNQWTKIGGAAKEIYGGVYGLFATNPDTGDIYSYSENASSWTNIGGPGKMFAVGINGIYGLSPDGMSVYGYGEGKSWVKIAGAISNGAIDTIYVGGAGDELYTTSADTGDLYHHTCGYLSTGQYVCTWTKIGGPGKMFAVNQAGNLCGLSPDGNGVYLYEGIPMQWTKIGGAAASIYAGYIWDLYATNPTTHDLWYYTTVVYIP